MRLHPVRDGLLAPDGRHGGLERQLVEGHDDADERTEHGGREPVHQQVEHEVDRQRRDALEARAVELAHGDPRAVPQPVDAAKRAWPLGGDAEAQPVDGEHLEHDGEEEARREPRLPVRRRRQLHLERRAPRPRDDDRQEGVVARDALVGDIAHAGPVGRARVRPFAPRGPRDERPHEDRDRQRERHEPVEERPAALLLGRRDLPLARLLRLCVERRLELHRQRGPLLLGGRLCASAAAAEVGAPLRRRAVTLRGRLSRFVDELAAELGRRLLRRAVVEDEDEQLDEEDDRDDHYRHVYCGGDATTGGGSSRIGGAEGSGRPARRARRRRRRAARTVMG